MGQRQDKTEIKYGDDCITCWEAGLTPKSVYVRLANVEKCSDAWCDGFPSPPNNHAFCLEQVPSFPCFYHYSGHGWELTYRARHTFFYPCGLWISSLPISRNYFHSETDIGTDCSAFFLNQNTCIFPNCGINGQAIVTDKLESIELLCALNIETSNDLFMEMSPLDDGSRVYKYCNLKVGTNVKIKLEP